MATTSAEIAAVAGAERIESLEIGQWRAIWRRFRRHRFAMAGGAIMLLFITISLLADVLAPEGYDVQDLFNRYKLPSSEHWLGTDDLGRDIVTRLIYGGRVSLTVGIVATVLATVIGVVVGAISGYLGGLIETVLMRLADIMLSLPALPILIILSAALGPGLQTIVIVLTLFGWMTVARLTHGSVLSLRHREFTEAARALGGGSFHIIARHMLPNSMAPIIVAATLGLGNRIIIEATLSFLGLGINPPVPSWGNMLQNAQGYIWSSPWLAVFPGTAIFITVLSVNFLGDGLRDALDPRLKI